jgi:hypothetical protein
MKNRVPIAVATIFGLVGIALLLAAASTALRHFDYNTINCGSVVSAKDPRDLVGRRAAVPLRLINANRQCEKLRTTRSHTATKFLVAGAIFLLVALAVPWFVRRTRRSRFRRRA